MTIYLCPSDKKYACSWEGLAEDILEHFEQEHDDLLYYVDTFKIDLEIPSENRLFLIDEEIYLNQTQITEKYLIIKLRYLGPETLAKKISYNILVRVNNELCQSQCICPTEDGSLTVDINELKRIFSNIECLTCTLNITKEFNNDDDGVFIEDEIFNEKAQEYLQDISILRKLSLEESTYPLPDDSFEKREVTLTRSNTTNFNESKRKNVNRAKSTLSLGAINETDSTMSCTNCHILLKPPIFLCPCGQNFCSECRNEFCRVCDEKITNERNKDLEDRYSQFLFPCKFKRFGCPEKLIYSDVYQHEINCNFCDYKCPMDECSFEGQFKGLCKHLKLIHGSTKMLESFILVFQNNPEAFLVNEEKGIFYCYVKYFVDSVLWEAKFCGPIERSFFCELKFKDSGKLKQPVLLRKLKDTYSVRMTLQDLKRLKLKPKNAILTINC